MRRKDALDALAISMDERFDDPRGIVFVCSCGHFLLVIAKRFDAVFFYSPSRRHKYHESGGKMEMRHHYHLLGEALKIQALF